MDFFYAKLNFFHDLFSLKPYNEATSRARELERAMKNGAPMTGLNTSFMFADIQLFQVDDNTLLYGKLLKYADRDEKVADEKLAITQLVTVPDRILFESQFVIEFKENHLLYTESKNHLNRNSFLVKFNDLINRGLSDSFICEAYPISDQYSFIERLRLMRIITELDLVIFPTNPYPSKTIEGIDKALKQQNIRSKAIKYRSKPGGLNIEDPEIRDQTIYADVGYGKGDAKGIDKNGKVQRISSKRSERQKTFTVEEKITNPFAIVQKINEHINAKNK